MLCEPPSYCTFSTNYKQSLCVCSFQTVLGLREDTNEGNREYFYLVWTYGVYVYTSECVSIGTCVTMLCRGQRTTSGVGSWFPPCLRWGLLLLVTVYVWLLACTLPGIFLSVSHLIAGVLGLQMHALPRVTWCGSWGFTPMSSYLCGKCFVHWVIFSTHSIIVSISKCSIA